MFGGVKITLTLCITILVSCVLFISYNEYSNRYVIVSNSDNSVYIFDKKSTVLNKCDAEGCAIIETKLPNKTSAGLSQDFQLSKLFSTDKPLTEDSATKVEAQKGDAEALDKLAPSEKKTSAKSEEKSESSKKTEAKTAEKTDEKSDKKESEKTNSTEKTADSEEEFVE